MMADTDQAEPVWFDAGLAFSCTKCGACCTGEEGFVWLNDDEIDRLTDRTELPREQFLLMYTHSVGRRVSLRERANGDCVFWKKGQGCTVYEDRPRQCRSWPFWNSNLESPDQWEQTRALCPGAGQGRVYTVDEILSQSRLIDI